MPTSPNNNLCSVGFSSTNVDTILLNIFHIRLDQIFCSCYLC